MIEKHFFLDEADPVLFYGPANANLRMLKALCPKLRIMARGNVLKAIGDEEELAAFEELFAALQKHCTKYNLLTEEDVLDTVDELDEIAAVDGVDVIFIGPFDLSQSMGIPGQVYDEKIEHVMDLVLAATKKHGKYAGIYTGSIEMAKKYRDMGFQYIIVGSDIKHFSTECKRVVQELKG